MGHPPVKSYTDTADASMALPARAKIHKMTLVHANGADTVAINVYDATRLQAKQTVNVGGAKAGASATGLANDATAYTATITIDGAAPTAISMVGSAAQTYTTLLAELETDIGAAGASVSIVGGNLVFVSDAIGATSTLSISDTTLFAALTGYVGIQAAINPGTSVAALKTNFVDGTTYNQYAEMNFNPPLRCDRGVSVDPVGTGTYRLYYTLD